MNMLRRIVELIETANLRMIGVTIGLVLGILYLFVGFWKSLVFVGFIVAGYLVGRWLDNQEDWRDIVQRLIPNKRD
jgi:uncharacterized membrane protein